MTFEPERGDAPSAAEGPLTEFRAAVRHDDRARVAALLFEHPELAGATNRKGLSLLVEARLRGHSAVVARIAAVRRRPGSPPLTHDELVALGDHRALSDRLGSNGARGDERVADGFTPLHRAAHLGESEALDALLEAGADPRVRAGNASRLTPEQSAACGRDPGLASRLGGGDAAEG